MKPYKFCLILIACSLLYSCNTAEVHQLTFKKSYSIEGNSILPDAIKVKRLFVAGDFLLATLNSDDYFLEAYAIETLEKRGHLAKKGNGPNEFPTSLEFDHASQLGEDVCIWVHDLNVDNLVRINVSESLKNQHTVINQVVKTKPESNFDTVFYLDSTKVIGRSTNTSPQMNRLQIYNPLADSIVKTVPLFPKVKRKRTDLEFLMNKYNYLYISHLGLKTDKTKIASAMCVFNRIDIFDNTGELERSILEGVEMPNDIIRDYLEAGNDDYAEIRSYYMGINTSNDYIYGLYYDQLEADYGKKTVKVQIRIFDWQGNPLSNITVPDYLANFTIDEKRGLMFGVDLYNEKILQYNIKQVLDEL